MKSNPVKRRHPVGAVLHCDMASGLRSTWKARPTALLLTVAAHALFVSLLLSGRREAPRPPARPPEPLSIAITLLPISTPEPAPQPPPAGDAPGEPAPSPAPVAPPRPATAISLPAPQVEVVPAPAPPEAGHVDWYALAAESAQRYVDSLPEPRQSVGAPVAAMREPCKPRESSFRWKKDSRSTGSAILTPGWEAPPADAHLFDDMMAGRRSVSSVPHHEECD